MRRRFVMIWLLMFFLFSSLLGWRLVVVKGPLVNVTNQGQLEITLKTPSPTPIPTTNIPLESALSSTQHLRPGFMGGIIFPQWGKQAYSSQDQYWISGLQEIAVQTNTHWLSLPITFHQSSIYSTEVQAQDDIPSPATISAAIMQAHAYGYQVFLYPLLTVNNGINWAGQVDFTTRQDANAWFSSYWQALRPYVLAASAANVDQLSIGNEFELLEGHFDDFWIKLIDQVHSIYNGHIVYSVNWSSLKYSLPQWFRYAGLSALGTSTYFSLTDVPERIAPALLPTLWRQRVLSQLDAFAQAVNKPIFISEIGYRNTRDAGYLPYQSDPGTRAPRDDAEQAQIYEAALQNIAHDQLISGVFIWAWSVPPYDPNHKPAAQVLKKWFSIL